MLSTSFKRGLNSLQVAFAKPNNSFRIHTFKYCHQTAATVVEVSHNNGDNVTRPLQEIIEDLNYLKNFTTEDVRLLTLLWAKEQLLPRYRITKHFMADDYFQEQVEIECVISKEHFHTKICNIPLETVKKFSAMDAFKVGYSQGIMAQNINE